MACKRLLIFATAGIIAVSASSCARTYHEEDAQMLMDKVKSDVASEDDYIRLIEEYAALVEETSKEVDKIRKNKDKDGAEKTMERLQTIAEINTILDKHPVPAKAQAQLEEALSLSDALAAKIINPIE